MGIRNERNHISVKPSLNLAHPGFPLKWITKITEAKSLWVMDYKDMQLAQNRNQLKMLPSNPL